jgi:2,3-bisphosphoglycerate-independent phosphoglycerate mutase
MMQYDGDALIPTRYLVDPPGIDRTMGEYLVHAGVRQMAISETQKFGHVTYFFNGNRTGKFDDALEDYIEIPSDRVPFEERPWMKAAEITDRVVEAIRKGEPMALSVSTLPTATWWATPASSRPCASPWKPSISAWRAS